MLVWYINLQRRTDRKVSIQANLEEKDVPQHQIHRFDATDRDQYSTPHDLVGYAEVIGFPEFRETRTNKWILQYLGYMVSYFKALRDISNQSENVLLMEDDYHLVEDYHQIVSSFAQLPDDVMFAMLGYNRHSDDFIQLPALDDTWAIGTPSNGNSANIYTPEGAGYLLDKCRSKMDTTPECVIQQLNGEPGLYSRLPDRIAIIGSPAMGQTDVMDNRWSDV